ncbi:uncharacterized protein si:dkey-85k15.4 [Rhinichthys klamathensis goyatoka]|uniref:uncharacterized protein si:dkey-85k15.4 n=1 Tax=Rhinichthys klamathensis goyatoka TaxID=3034132 RepID=UPI0024B5FB41|nr:uncharacterized protein si:dkey-85k15.4 [Rhinichthys klamathensis goyatoka]
MDLQAMEAVSGPLNEGIVSICNICKSLLDAHVDPNTGTCSNYKQIRKHIEHAEQCLKTSETMIKGELGCLDGRMEQLTKEKKNVEQRKKEKRMAMDKLHIEKKSAEESLKYSNAALEQAKKIVDLRKDEINRETGRKNTGEGVAIAGAVVTIIPVLGWIAGPIMIATGAGLSVDASKAIRDAEDELKKNESQVNDNSIKVSNYQSRISTIQNEIIETDKVLNKIQREIEEVKQHLEVTADFQHVVRKAVTLLSVLSGRVTVLEKQTQRFILWEPVIKCMEDVMKATGNVAENRLLYRQGVPGFINALRENVGGLLALCNSPKHSEYDSYY